MSKKGSSALLLILAFGVTAAVVVLAMLVIQHDDTPLDLPDAPDEFQHEATEVVAEINGDDGEVTTPVAAGEGSIMGMVVEENGAPVFEASIRAVRTKSLDGPLKPAEYGIFETTSSEDGRFFFSDLPSGIYDLSATWQSLAGHDATKLSPSRRRSDDHEIVLKPAGEISGKVKQPDGSPIKAAIVMPLQQRGSITETDTRGRFTIRGLPEGKHTIVAMARDYTPRSETDVETGTNDLEITLFPPGYRPEKTPTAGQGEVEAAPQEIRPNRPPPARFPGRRDPDMDPTRPPGLDTRDPRHIPPGRKPPPDGPPKKNGEQR